VSQYARRNLRHCVQYTQYAAVPQCDAASYTVLLTQSGAIHRVLRRVVLRRVLRRAYCGLRVLRTADLRHSTATRRHARWSVLSRNERRRMAPLGVQQHSVTRRITLRYCVYCTQCRRFRRAYCGTTLPLDEKVCIGVVRQIRARHIVARC